MPTLEVEILNWGELLSNAPTTPQYDPDVTDVGYVLDSGGGSPGIYRSVMRWSLADLPVGAVITEAVLTLWQLASGGSNGGIQDVYATKSVWVSGQTSWNRYKTGSAWETPGGDLVTDYATTAQPADAPVADTEIEVDVTGWTQRAQDLGDTLNLIFKARNEAPGVDDDCTYIMGAPGQVPTLTITYDLPGDVEAAVRETLIGLPAVTGQFGERIYVDESPTGTTLPRVVVRLASSAHDRHMTAADGLADARVEVTVFSDTPQGRNNSAHVIRSTLHGKPAATLGTGIRAIAMKSCTLETQRGGFTDPEDGSANGLYWRMMMFRIWYVESVPTY